MERTRATSPGGEGARRISWYGHAFPCTLAHVPTPFSVEVQEVDTTQRFQTSDSQYHPIFRWKIHFPLCAGGSAQSVCSQVLPVGALTAPPPPAAHGVRRMQLSAPPACFSLFSPPPRRPSPRRSPPRRPPPSDYYPFISFSSLTRNLRLLRKVPAGSYSASAGS